VKTFAVLYFPFNSSIFFAPFLFLILLFTILICYIFHTKKTEASKKPVGFCILNVVFFRYRFSVEKHRFFLVPVSPHSWQGRAAFFGSWWRRTAFLQYAEKFCF